MESRYLYAKLETENDSQLNDLRGWVVMMFPMIPEVAGLNPSSRKYFSISILAACSTVVDIISPSKIEMLSVI